MPFIPHTQDDVVTMIQSMDITSIDTLFDEIPSELKIQGLNNIPQGISEMDMLRLMSERASQDRYALNFIGAGAYQHHIPSAVWDLTTRGEFMTAYTPYQAEASQGTLQILYEYQTMMSGLMGLDVSNASLYDGASALAEAALMAVRCQRKCPNRRILVPKTLNPAYRKVLKTIVASQDIELIELPFENETGRLQEEALKAFEGEPFVALIIPQPNFFGQIEAVDKLTDWAHQQKALVIGVVNPIAVSWIKPPGEWGEAGADIACGEGQPLGVPLASGGPYFGFLCSKQATVRQMPGRIIGKTNDLKGKSGYTLTLQAREQHIRRGKATSNICTNQGLLVTAATIYLSLLGEQGLVAVAKACYDNKHELAKKLEADSSLKPCFSGSYFHERVYQLRTNAKDWIKKMADLGIQGGYVLTEDYPELGEAVLICATETKTQADLEAFVKAANGVHA